MDRSISRAVRRPLAPAGVGLLMAGLSVVGAAQAPAPEGGRSAPTTTSIHSAFVELAPLGDSGVIGMVEFTLGPDGMSIAGQVEGLAPGAHGIHIHEFGDCSAADGSSAGDHFAAGSRPHGAPDAAPGQRHIGDLGNLEADHAGKAKVSMVDPLLRFEGDHGILERSLIVHAERDDLTSQPAGNAGARVACGVIREVAKAPIAAR